MVPEIRKYSSSIMADVDIHNGGSFFIRYFCYKAVFDNGHIYMHKCFLGDLANNTISESVLERYGKISFSDRVSKVNFISAINKNYVISSYVFFDEGRLIVFDTDDCASYLLFPNGDSK